MSWSRPAGASCSKSETGEAPSSEARSRSAWRVREGRWLRIVSICWSMSGECCRCSSTRGAKVGKWPRAHRREAFLGVGAHEFGRCVGALGPERGERGAGVDSGASLVEPPARVPGVNALDELVGLDARPFVVVLVEPVLEFRVIDHVKVAAEEQGAAHGDDLGDDLSVVVLGEGAFRAREAFDRHAVGTQEALREGFFVGVELTHSVQAVALAPLVVPPALLSHSAQGRVVSALGVELLYLQERVFCKGPGTGRGLRGKAVGYRWNNLHESAGELDIGGVKAPVRRVDESVLVEVGLHRA